MNFLTPYLAWIKMAGYALALALLAWGAYKIHDTIWQDGYDAANVRAAKIIAEFAKAEADAQAKAREAEQATGAALTAADAAYQLGLTDANQAAADTVADLAAGNLSLRNHWRGCIASGDLSATASATRERDAAIQLQRESAGRIVQYTEQCDAQGNAAIEVIRALGVKP